MDHKTTSLESLSEEYKKLNEQLNYKKLRANEVSMGKTSIVVIGLLILFFYAIANNKFWLFILVVFILIVMKIIDWQAKEKEIESISNKMNSILNKMSEKRKKLLAKFSVEDIDELTGQEFENFLSELFDSLGYYVNQTPYSGDQGADLIIEKNGKKVAVQAKRSNNKITNKAVQEVSAAVKFYHCTKGMVVTNNYFTKSAYSLADSNNIELVDNNKLESLLDQAFKK